MEKINLRESEYLDSEKLSEFFTEIPMIGKIDIKIQRQVDFFSLYRRLGIDFTNYILEDSNKILGTASFLHLNVNIDDQSNSLSLACDLRVSNQRKAIINWSKFFLPQLDDLETKKNIQHFITILNLDNLQAINAFVRTKQKKNHPRPLYELIKKFNLVSIHGFYPLQFQINPNIKVIKPTRENFPNLIQYIQKKIKNYDLVPIKYVNEFEIFIHESLLYSMNHFYMAVNHDNKIVGCCYPLSSSLLQDYFPQNYDSRANNFRQFLKLTHLLGFGRKLTKPFSSTQKDQTLQFIFLHFLFFDHPDVFKNLIHHSFLNSKNNEFLIYNYELDQFNYRPPKGSISTESLYGLYEIRHPQYLDPNSHPSLKKKIKKNIWLDGLVF